MQYLQNLRHKLFSLLLLSLLFLVVFLQNKDLSAFFQAKPKSQTVTLDHVKKVFPQAASFNLPSTPEQWGKVLDGSGKELGRLLYTSPYADSIEGFGGPMPFVIGADSNGRILGLSLLLNAESESFLQELEQKKFFQHWNGLTPEEALAKRVDTVTGATMTTSAVIRSVHNRMAAVSGQGAPVAALNIGRLIRNVLACIVVVFAYLIFLFPKRGNRYRTVLLLSSVVVLGFANGYFISTALTYRWLLNGIPWSGLPILVFIVFLALAVHILTNKQFYCSHLCPYGCAQELAGKILAKKPPMPPVLSRIGKHSRKIVFGVLVMLLSLGCSFDLTYIEPFSGFLYSYAAWSVIGLALLFFVVSIFYPRFWCRFLCPSGQLLEIFCRVPQPEENEEDKEKNHMKFYKTLILLLVLIIVILLLKPHLPVFSSSAGGSDTISIIHSRKSVRKYVEKPVNREDLNILLKAGMAAPSAADKRPWAFLVVTEKEKLVALSEGLTTGRMLKEAGAAIVVCGVTKKMLPGDFKALPEVSKEFWVQDCSAVTQNILLAVESLKLGAVWIGVYPLEDRVAVVRKTLDIPEDIIPFNVISIGHPLGLERPKNKYDETTIHWNKW
jgi:nitroreductase/Na+-translocating ferredoxin:NAD+ oxidoreductase RnfG subunit